MKRLTALFLALLMGLASFSGLAEEAYPGMPLSTAEMLHILVDALAEVVTGDKPGLNATLIAPEGEQLSAGFGLADGKPVLHFAAPGGTVLLNPDSAYFTDEQGSITAPVKALVDFIAAANWDGRTLPCISLEDVTSLAPLGMQLLQGLLRCEGLSYSASDYMLSLHLDLDAHSCARLMRSSLPCCRSTLRWSNRSC